MGTASPTAKRSQPVVARRSKTTTARLRTLRRARRRKVDAANLNTVGVQVELNPAMTLRVLRDSSCPGQEAEQTNSSSTIATSNTPCTEGIGLLVLASVKPMDGDFSSNEGTIGRLRNGLASLGIEPKKVGAAGVTPMEN